MRREAVSGPASGGTQVGVVHGRGNRHRARAAGVQVAQAVRELLHGVRCDADLIPDDLVVRGLCRALDPGTYTQCSQRHMMQVNSINKGLNVVDGFDGGQGESLVPPYTRGSVSHGSQGDSLVPPFTGFSVSLSLSFSLMGGRAKALCLLIHAEASLSL